ncbi:MAG: IS5/IS1182 family transposase, partial [Tolypothrix sp. T3-bin4]|nr:IS5/IS1182 family transposase [Tolypothrix sp. T3-bin4]
MSSMLEAVEKNPKEVKRLLGIDREQLRQLMAQVELRHQQ